MTTVTAPTHTLSFPRIYEGELQSTSSIDPTHLGEEPHLNDLSSNQAFSKSTPIYRNTMQAYSNAFTNSYTHNTHNVTTISGQSTHRIPTLVPTVSLSSNSSTTSSPNETKTHVTGPVVTSYFNSFRTRSQSLSIPAPTSTCPNCGLRRPSISSDQSTTPSTLDLATRSSPPARTHLPSHLHCPDSCPDDVHPTKDLTSPAKTPLRRHHRRRSSLCYAESLVDDADTIDNGGVPSGIRSSWENRAESIASKVVLNALGNDISRVPEDAVVEE